MRKNRVAKENLWVLRGEKNCSFKSKMAGVGLVGNVTVKQTLEGSEEIFTRLFGEENPRQSLCNSLRWGVGGTFQGEGRRDSRQGTE